MMRSLLFLLLFYIPLLIKAQNSMELRWDNATPYIDFSNDSYIDFDVRMLLTDDNSLFLQGGYLGIGTGTPQASLHIRDGAYWSSHNYGASLVVDGPHHNAIGIFNSGNTNPIALVNVDGDFNLAKMPPLGNTTSPPETLLRISADAEFQLGNVNDNKKKKIRLPGTYNFEEVNLKMGSNGNGQLEFVTHSNESNSGGVKIYSEDGASLSFQTAAPQSSYGALNYSTQMVLKNNGNLGIGTSTPGSYRLAVEGKIGAREVNVTTAAWSDYVFDNDYPLQPLEQVDAYIKENKHLPGVPSEADVMKNGQDLGAMNAILLKKIEELTLYVVELKKEVELQKTKSSLQQSEIDKLKNQ